MKMQYRWSNVDLKEKRCLFKERDVDLKDQNYLICYVRNAK